LKPEKRLNQKRRHFPHHPSRADPDFHLQLPHLCRGFTMIIYFACSITGGRRDEPVYQQIVAALQADGHEVPTALLAGSNVMELELVIDPISVYRRDTGWIEGCDLLVAEVSTPSHGVGYEIAYALGLGKRVLCLHRSGLPVSKMITGNRDHRLTVMAYADGSQAVQQLRAFLYQLDT
jgi:hypothetical protein